jgi:proton-translocating NADH-quinone oxidoreductase chain M
VSGLPILSLMLAIPAIAAILCLYAGDRNARVIALAATLIDFALGVLLWANFDIGGAQWQFTERADLFGRFQWALGIDGMALMLIMLSVFLMPLCILASWDAIKSRVGLYMAMFLIMEVVMIGVFMAQDLLLFYIFFEAGLIPMYFIIGIWGGANRIYAAFKFFLYTLLGSVLMLIAMIAMIAEAGTTDIPTLLNYDFPPEMQTWLWLAFFASLAVKMPMWPVHTWLPDAHVQAPTAGSMILAGVLLKLGAYGFLRFMMPMFPDASAQLMWLVFGLSMVAVVYTSLVALVQNDMKKLIAYSSVAHMAIVTAGLFAFNQQGIEGALIIMLSHGVVSAALFFCVGVIYDRLHTRNRPLRRPRREHAGLCALLHAVHHGVDRPAGDERFRRRVPEPARHLRGVERRRLCLHHRHHTRRRVHALSLSPRRVRRIDQGRCEGDARPQSARMGDHGAARRRGAVDGRLSRKLPRADARRRDHRGRAPRPRETRGRRAACRGQAEARRSTW